MLLTIKKLRLLSYNDFFVIAPLLLTTFLYLTHNDAEGNSGLIIYGRPDITTGRDLAILHVGSIVIYLVILLSNLIKIRYITLVKIISSCVSLLFPAVIYISVYWWYF